VLIVMSPPAPFNMPAVDVGFFHRPAFAPFKMSHTAVGGGILPVIAILIGCDRMDIAAGIGFDYSVSVHDSSSSS